jgi:DNA repair protein RadD
MFTLRPYQIEAVDAVYRHLREHDDNPCVVIPTAGGKTPVMATICRDAVAKWGGRVLILAHVKELLEQAVDKLNRIAPELMLQVGIYSAGLGSRETERPIIVAGIQSVYRRAEELGRFDLVLTDECFVEGTMIATPSGKVPIEQVQPDMYVHNALGIGRVMATSAKHSTALVTLEYDDGSSITCTPNHPIFTESGWREAGSLAVGSLAYGVESVRVLRGRVSSVAQGAIRREHHSAERESVEEAAVLLSLLLEDPQQLYAFAGGPSEDQPDAQGSRVCAADSGRQRSTDRTTAKAACSAGEGMDTRAGRVGYGPSGAWSAQERQDRPGQPPDETRHRVERTQPSLSVSSGARLPKDALPGAKRLVSLSHHERASDRVVFNLQVSGHPSYFANGVLVHNCHMIPPEGEGMYRTFLSEARIVNPNVRLIGLTATPFRMTTGMICSPENLLNKVCYEVSVRELIVQGYLCPLVTKGAREDLDTSGLHVRAGEFVADEVEALMDQERRVEAACAEIVEQTKNRRSVLVFASGIQHARHVAETLARMGGQVATVFGETPSNERARTIADFRAGRLKYLVNVGVLTHGFDAPNIDCVAMLRPTMSPGLWYQACGRGFRIHPGKENCLILDYGGNALRHGPVDDLRIKENGKGTGVAPAKKCPECLALIATGYAICPQCGYAFPPPERQEHDARASTAAVLSGEVTIETYTVQEMMYSVHIKRGAPENHPRSMRVDYRIGFSCWQSEWICFEHTGYARHKAELWWRKRSNVPVPDTAEDAVYFAEHGALAPTKSITVRHVAGEEFDRIVDYELGEKPAYRDPGEDDAEAAGELEPDLADEEIPF